MSSLLTQGAVTTLVRMPPSESPGFQPIVQVINVRQVGETTDPKRFRVVLSDGDYYVHGILASRLNEHVLNGSIKENAFIQLKEYMSNTIQNRIVIIILELNIVVDDNNEEDSIVGGRIGQPQDVLNSEYKAEEEASTTTNTTTERLMIMDGPCPNSAFEKSPLTIIHCKILIHGPASQPPTLNGTIIMRGGKILYAGPHCNDISPYNDDDDNDKREFTVECAMPGMWDVHSHFFGALPIQTPHYEKQWKWIFEDRAVKVGRDVPRLLRIMESGFTSLREVGGMGKHLKVLIEEGSTIGPRIYHSNCPIHITGGHCDLPPDVPLQCFTSLVSIQDADAFGGVLTGGVDGVDDCVKAIRQTVRTGASCIKLCCSGGVMTPNSGMPTQQQFSAEEVRAMTQEASRHDRLVCAHCHSKQGIMNALENGVQCIEHCTLADEEVIEKLLEKDAFIVPTRWVIEKLVEPGGIDGPTPPGMSDVSRKKLKMVYKASRVAHAKAIEAGVKIATGCDIFVAEGYGTSAKELEHLVGLGMTPQKAIEAATVNGPLTLGKQGPKSGQIKEGYDADVICLDINPLDDVKLLQDVKHIKLVFKGGTIQKNILDSK